MANIFNIHYTSFILVGIAIVAVFNYIPFISDYAFWLVLAAFIMLWGHRPPAK